MIPVSSPVRDTRRRRGSARRSAVPTGWFGLVIALACAVAGILVAGGHWVPALMLSTAPSLLLLIVRSEWIGLAGVALLPFPAAEMVVHGFQVSGADVALGACAVVILSRDRQIRAVLTNLRPTLAGLVPFGAVVALNVAVHPGETSLLRSVQRLGLVVIPLLCGALLWRLGVGRSAARLFVLAAALSAVFWIVTGLKASGTVLGVQKNPAGQFMVDAVLLLLAVPGLFKRVYLPVGLLLVGILFTESRGAVLGLVVGLFVLVTTQAAGDRRTAHRVARAGVLAVILGAGFFALPAGAEAHLTNSSRSANYTIEVRTSYWSKAWDEAVSHPWTGDGIGNVSDPENVVLLTAAEGGLPLVIGLLALIWALVLAGVRTRQPWGTAAACLIVATFTHGLVDVFWVRNTTEVAWLCLGIALASAAGRPPESRRLT